MASGVGRPSCLPDNQTRSRCWFGTAGQEAGPPVAVAGAGGRRGAGSPPTRLPPPARAGGRVDGGRGRDKKQCKNQIGRNTGTPITHENHANNGSPPARLPLPPPAWAGGGTSKGVGGGGGGGGRRGGVSITPSTMKAACPASQPYLPQDTIDHVRWRLTERLTYLSIEWQTVLSPPCLHCMGLK